MYNCAYTTVKEMTAEHAKRICDLERQNKYERSIVRSVPERAIAACFAEPNNDERCDPG